MKKAYLILILIFCFITALNGQTKKIAPETIQQYFDETKAATKKYKKLWDFDLYGPMLIVNPFNRTVYANYPDNLGVLKKEGNLYVGKLPRGILLGNVATKWGGRTWAMVLTIFITGEKEDRIELFTHELFHRVQPQFGFPKANDGNNGHLDSKNGRIYLRLELQALVKALKENNSREATKHIKNALRFRKFRYQLFPNAYASEATIELNEGVASYTGKVHRGLKGKALSDFMDSKIQQFLKQPSYVQLFAYQTIPAYGFLLVDKNKFWNKQLNSKTNLTEYFNRAFSFVSVDLSKVEIDSFGKQYGIRAIVSQETEREIKIQKQIAEYKRKFVEQPRFTIPFKKKRVAYDTRFITTIKGIGFVYPTFTARDVWGVLEVKKVGGLLNQKKTTVTITPPTSIEGNVIKGVGWTLTLKEGYKLEKDEKSGNFTLKEVKENPVSLEQFLTRENGYIKIPLTKMPSGHLHLKAVVNGVQGEFILDTGAGATIVETKRKDKFNLKIESTDVTAAGAGGRANLQKSPNNKLKIGGIEKQNFSLYLMNLDHINAALKTMGIKEVDGVIGADILSANQGIIDYSKLTLYLKK